MGRIPVRKCDICGHNKQGVEDKRYGDKEVGACKECRDSMKYTQRIIVDTAKKLVREKPDIWQIWEKGGKIRGVTSLISTS